MGSSIVLDTCALIWLTLDPSELSGRAHKAISASESIFVSSISIWEIGIKNKRGKLPLEISFNEYVDRLDKCSDFSIVAVDHRSWADSIGLNWEHRDPADRVIVALAKKLGASLITEDKLIADYYKKTIS